MVLKRAVNCSTQGSIREPDLILGVYLMFCNFLRLEWEV